MSCKTLLEIEGDFPLNLVRMRTGSFANAGRHSHGTNYNCSACRQASGRDNFIWVDYCWVVVLSCLVDTPDKNAPVATQPVSDLTSPNPVGKSFPCEQAFSVALSS